MAVVNGIASELTNPVASPNVVPKTLVKSGPGGTTPGIPAIYGSASQRGPARAPQNFSGVAAEQFGERFWFDHVHIIPQQFSLGNVLTTQQRDFEVYNGYRKKTKQVATLVEAGFDGVSIIAGNETPPYSIPPNQSELYTIEVGTIGPPNVDASVTYTFTTGEVLVVTITGTRVIVFAFEPQGSLGETYEFLTDIIPGADNTEQRNAVRFQARRSLVIDSYRYGDEQENMLAENLLYNWAGRLFAVPIMHDATVVTADVAVGATIIPVESTADREFEAGAGKLALARIDSQLFGAVQVTDVFAASLEVDPMQAAIPAGTPIMPLKFGYLRGAVQQKMYPVNVRDLSITWDLIGTVDWADETGFAVYKSLPVYEDAFELRSGLTYTSVSNHGNTRFGNKAGKIFQTTQFAHPQALVSAANKRAETREAIQRMRGFMYARRGQQNAFWMPSSREDFQIESDISAPTSTINVKSVNYSNFVFDDAQRKDLRIEYIDGTVDYREVVNAAQANPDREELTLDANLSQDASAANVRMISYLIKRRLGNDTFTIAREFEDHADIGFIVKDIEQ